MNVTQGLIGMKIFAHNNPTCFLLAEHDQIYGPHKDTMLLSIAELEDLDDADWFVDSDTDHWIHYC